MKKIALNLLAVSILTFATTEMKASGEPTKDSTTTSQIAHSTQIAELSNRVAEIQAMDFSAMSRAEKKVLKKELNSIQRVLKVEETKATADTSTGVYISFGAIIIIILLLVILL